MEERALTPALPLFKSFRNSFHSATPCALRHERRDRQFLGRARDAEQLQSGFVRQTVALVGVHVLARPNEVFSRVGATARVG